MRSLKSLVENETQVWIYCRNEFLKHGDKKNADIFSSILNEFFDDREEKQHIYNQIVN